MGKRLRIPWVGTSAAAVDGDYAAVVGLGGEGTREAVDGARFIAEAGGGRFEFADGTSVDLKTVLESVAR